VFVTEAFNEQRLFEPDKASPLFICKTFYNLKWCVGEGRYSYSGWWVFARNWGGEKGYFVNRINPDSFSFNC
jgi:hypothetical protein